MTTVQNHFRETIQKAKNKSVLVELSKKQLEALKKESNSFSEFEIYSDIYNQGITLSDQTNVIFIDAKSGAHAQIFHHLYHLLEENIKNKLSLDSFTKLTVYSAMQGLGGLFGGSVSDKLSQFGSEIFTKVSELSKESSALLDYLGKQPESWLLNAAEDASNSAGEIVNGKHGLGDKLHLSQKAQEKIIELANSISKEQSAADAMQLCVDLLKIISSDAPKLIVINNPFELDESSLALISLFFSEVKDKLSQGKLLESNLSMVFNYTKQQVYENDGQQNTRQLLALRNMLQRYEILERFGTILPSSAIKSHHFVGRKFELEQLSAYHHSFITQCDESNDKINHITLISGEPGYGKTTLVNKHIATIFPENISSNQKKLHSQLRLNILNQKGHSSQVTGIASLQQSIGQEIERLKVYCKNNDGIIKRTTDEVEREFHKQYDNIKKALRGDSQKKSETCKVVAKTIANLTSLGSIFNAADSAMKRMNIDYSVQQSSNALLEDESFNKTVIFDGLKSALRELKFVSEQIYSQSQLPIFIFIDDLQWVDELTAEFILTELLPNFCCEIITTSRTSDSQSIYKALKQKSDENPYKVTLLEQFKVIASNDSGSSLQIKNYVTVNNVRELKLTGANQEFLIDLLQSAFKHLTKEQALLVANKIIQELVNDDVKERDHIATLFAVETINLISDERFYKRRKIEGSSLLSLLRTNSANHTSDEISKSLNEVFNMLKVERSDAYLTLQGDKEHYQAFNLASYAVLDERMHLIGDYFEESGGVATFSLKLAAFLGAPFESELVNYLISAYANLDVNEYSRFRTLILDLNSCSGFSIEQYDLLSEIFEVLDRVSLQSSQFKFRHDLFKEFLNLQMQQYLKNKFKVEKSTTTLEKFLELTLHLINKWQDHCLLELSEDSEQITQQARISCLALGYELNPTHWWSGYAKSISSFSGFHRDKGCFEQCKELRVQAFTICKNYIDFEDEECAFSYIYCLLNLINSEGVKNNKEAIEQCIEITIKFLKLRHDKYSVNQRTKNRWLDTFVISVGKLVNYYLEQREIENAKRLTTIHFKICSVYSKSNLFEDYWYQQYLHSKHNIAKYYKTVKNNDLAICTYNELINSLTEESSNLAIEFKATFLSEIAYCYSETEQLEKAIESLKISKDLYHSLFEISPRLYSMGYITVLSWLAIFKVRSNKENCIDSINLLKVAVLRCEELISKGYEEFKSILEDQKFLLSELNNGNVAICDPIPEEYLDALNERSQAVLH